MAKIEDIHLVRPPAGVPRRYVLILEEQNIPGQPRADLAGAVRQLAKLARRNFSLSAAELHVIAEDDVTEDNQV